MPRTTAAPPSLQANLDGSGMRVFARGLRILSDLDWEPQTKTLWTVVNELNLLGDDLVPDYLTSVKDGDFYGWPYSYFGQLEDPRKKGQRPDPVAKAIKPDYALGAHTAALRLGILQWQSISQTLSWRRLHRHARLLEPLQNGRVQIAFVLFSNGKPTGPMEDILTGFTPNAEPSSKPTAGRSGSPSLPTARCWSADDSGGKVWRVTVKK